MVMTNKFLFLYTSLFSNMLSIVPSSTHLRRAIPIIFSWNFYDPSNLLYFWGKWPHLIALCNKDQTQKISSPNITMAKWDFLCSYSRQRDEVYTLLSIPLRCMCNLGTGISRSADCTAYETALYPFIYKLYCTSYYCSIYLI